MCKHYSTLQVLQYTVSAIVSTFTYILASFTSVKQYSSRNNPFTDKMAYFIVSLQQSLRFMVNLFLIKLS